MMPPRLLAVPVQVQGSSRWHVLNARQFDTVADLRLMVIGLN